MEKGDKKEHLSRWIWRFGFASRASMLWRWRRENKEKKKTGPLRFSAFPKEWNCTRSPVQTRFTSHTEPNRTGSVWKPSSARSKIIEEKFILLIKHLKMLDLNIKKKLNRDQL